MRRVYLSVIFFTFYIFTFIQSTWSSTPGLPFIEDFSDNTLQDIATSIAQWSTDEQQLKMAFKGTQYGAFAAGIPGGFGVSLSL